MKEYISQKTKGFEPEISVVGQLSSAENTLSVLPDKKTICEFASEAIRRIPGIKRCFVCMPDLETVSNDFRNFCNTCSEAFSKNVQDRLEGCSYIDQKSYKVFRLKTSERSFGLLVLKVGQPEQFLSYSPFISNFCNAVSITIENLDQRKELLAQNKELESHRKNLEMLVEERTEALKKREKLLNAVEKIARIGGWEWDVDKRVISWTEEWLSIHGIDPQAPPPDPQHFLDVTLACFNSEDRTIIQKAFNRCVSEGVEYDLEFPFNTLDGKNIWIRTLGKPVREHGRIVKVIGHYMDITDQKEKENNLKEAQKEIKTLRSVLPFCSFCNKIRNENGNWERIDEYIQDHSDADVSHSICPECAREHYPDLDV